MASAMSVEECEEQGDHGPVCPQKTDLSENIMFSLSHNGLFKVLLLLTREHNLGTDNVGLSFPKCV